MTNNCCFLCQQNIIIKWLRTAGNLFFSPAFISKHHGSSVEAEWSLLTHVARLLPCSAVLKSRTGLKRAKRSGIQAQTTLISVPVTTLELKGLKSTVWTDCLKKTKETAAICKNIKMGDLVLLTSIPPNQGYIWKTRKCANGYYSMFFVSAICT